MKIDGVLAGRIRLGGTAEFPVEPGRHEVQITVDWYASKPLDIHVGDGRRRELDAGVGAYLDAFFRPRQYFRLEIASAT